jgi:hypothetical protein
MKAAPYSDLIFAGWMAFEDQQVLYYLLTYILYNTVFGGAIDFYNT